MAPLQARRRTTTTTQRAALRRHAQHRALNQQQLASWFEEQFGHRPSPGRKPLGALQRAGHYAQRRPTPEEATYAPLARARNLPLRVAASDQSQVPTSTDLIKAAAIRFWHCTRFSNGWLEKFKRRHGISEHTRHGGASSVDEALSAEQLVAVQAIAAQFHASNTYNCDESGLSWKTVPDKGQATDAIAGTKHEKARMTAHSCCNADGSHKLPIWFIGKHQKPRCFGAANINLNSLGCY
ncbi:hypothetical protein E4T44_06530 [Aureobasidium sp. EXF-8845]|nr:hypothetical protein E4T44_06530 [Aureobasidium sp. EXF-8845]KAI4857998.1 hypothetical protein E4T45_00491 [Aureobasidium sp. EXF-8846]